MASRIVGLALLDERRRADDDARDAEAALHAALEDERFADDAPRLLGQAFERDDVVAVHLLRLPQAGQRGPAVDHHEAAAAGAFGRAAVLGRDDAALLAQDLEQVHSRLVGGFGGLCRSG